MASCQDNESKISPAESEVPQIQAQHVAPAGSAPSDDVLAKAIADDQLKAVSKYGNIKKKSTEAMRTRMMGGGKQYFDSGDHALGRNRPNAPTLEPASVDILRNRKPSIPNKIVSRLS